VDSSTVKKSKRGKYSKKQTNPHADQSVPEELKPILFWCFFSTDWVTTSQRMS